MLPVLSGAQVRPTQPPARVQVSSFLPWGPPPRGPRTQHLYFLDDAHIQAGNIELLHGAAAEALLPPGIVQPDAVTALVLLPNEDDVGPAIGGCVSVLPRGDRHVVRNNCKRSWEPSLTKGQRGLGQGLGRAWRLGNDLWRY